MQKPDLTGSGPGKSVQKLHKSFQRDPIRGPFFSGNLLSNYCTPDHPPPTGTAGPSRRRDTLDFMVISTKYTHADLLAMPEDNKRREILDGNLIVSPSPKLFHQRIVHRF